MPLVASDPKGGFVICWTDPADNHRYLAQIKLLELDGRPRLVITSDPQDLGVVPVRAIAFSSPNELAISIGGTYFNQNYPELLVFDRTAGVVVDGSGGDNILKGNAGDDTIHGFNGNDTISGGGGFDQIFAGKGDDEVRGNDGRDLIYGGAGADTIAGNAGRDLLYGEDGSDKLYGGTGDDRLYGGLGGDRMDGGEGNDWYELNERTDRIVERAGQGEDLVYTSISWTMQANVENVIVQGDNTVRITGNSLANFMKGSWRNDLLSGLDGNDLIVGGDGNDRLDGGGGNDQLAGQFNNDTVSGGSGNDALSGGAGRDVLAGGSGDDSLDGGAGADTASYADAVNGVVVSLNVVGEQATGNGLDVLVAIENLQGSVHDDTLEGNARRNTLAGNGGADRLTGLGGADNFVFDAIDLIGVTAAKCTVISDFSSAQKDRILLSDIDANTKVAGDQAFAFIGSAAFSRQAGELRYDVAGSLTTIMADRNGDGVADFWIKLEGAPEISATDFVL